MITAYTPIDIIIADDHEFFRDGFSGMIKKIPEINLLAEACDGEELIRLTREFHPEVIVTDIKMPKIDGIEATKQIKKEFPSIGIIALSMYDEEDQIVEMLEAGAKGYLLKNAHKDEIIAAVKSVNKDEAYYCRDTTDKLAHMIANSDFHPFKKKIKPDFSDREIEIIKLICKQYSNKQIADYLSLSKRTIEGYREKILEKIDAINTVGIVIYALKNKII
jgi:Response regulator containing a CheY-like receiver domain and an HTH DNA-binding domain